MISALVIDEALRRNMAVGINKSKTTPRKPRLLMNTHGGGPIATVSSLFIKFSKTISKK